MNLIESISYFVINWSSINTLKIVMKTIALFASLEDAHKIHYIIYYYFFN